MNCEVKSKSTIREYLKLISTIISWTVFTLLVICAAFLIYYFVATKIFIHFGSKYEPKFSLYTIISPSMVPNINVYDVVIDLRVDEPEDIEIGDVITFYSDSPEVHGGTITHRVISIIKDKNGSYSYQTKGDNNLVEDSSIVPFEKIVGKVALRIPQLGRVQFFLASSFGWLLLLLIPALYIIFKDINRIIKAKKGITPVANEPTHNKPSKLKEVMSRPIFGTKPKADTKPISTPPPEIEGPPATSSTPAAIYAAYDEEVDLDDLPKLKE